MSRPQLAALVSGPWRGHYQQMGHRGEQSMTLEFADGVMRGDGVDAVGRFTIDGEYRRAEGELRLGWIKTYDRGHSVLYLGHVEGDAVVGAWSIDRWNRGTFALRPAPTREDPRP